MGNFDQVFFNKYIRQMIEFVDQNKYKKGIKILLKAYQYSMDNKNTAGVIISSKFLVEVYLYIGEGHNAHPFIDTLIKIYTQAQESKKLAEMFNCLGRILSSEGKIQSAIDALRKAIKILENINSKKSLAIARFNLAENLIFKGFFEEAIENFHNSLEFFKKRKITNMIIMNYVGIANCKALMEDFNFISDILPKIETNLDSIKNPQFLAKSLLNLSYLHKTLNNKEMALKLIKDCIGICEENDFKLLLAISLTKLGLFELDEKNYQDSINVFTSVLEMSEEYNYESNLELVFLGLGEANYQIGNLDIAEEWFKKIIAFKEVSITNKIRTFRYLASISLKSQRDSEAFRYITLALNNYRLIFDSLKNNETRLKFKKEFEFLPVLLELLNVIIETNDDSINLAEIIEVKGLVTDLHKVVKETVEDSDFKKFLEQNKKLEYKITKKFNENIDYIRSKLDTLNYLEILRDFNEALEIYSHDKKSPIAIIRIVLEGLVKKMVLTLKENYQNMRRSLEIIENHNILHSTPSNRGDLHLEVNSIYKIFGLLSNYGSHPNIFDSNMCSNLLIQCIGWLDLLLRRFN